MHSLLSTHCASGTAYNNCMLCLTHCAVATCFSSISSRRNKREQRSVLGTARHLLKIAPLVQSWSLTWLVMSRGLVQQPHVHPVRADSAEL